MYLRTPSAVPSTILPLLEISTTRKKNTILCCIRDYRKYQVRPVTAPLVEPPGGQVAGQPAEESVPGSQSCVHITCTVSIHICI